MKDKTQLHSYDQKTPSESPWKTGQRCLMLLWEVVWTLFCVWTPKPFNPWRLLWLRIFGAKIHGLPFVHQRARIQIPWRLTMHDRSCLGDRANAYSMGEIEITIGEDAFVGARAFIMPGVFIGAGAVVGACSVVCHEVEPNAVVAGNPARSVSERKV